MNPEKSLRTKILPLPRTTDELVELMRKVLELPNTQELRVTPSGLTVQRFVDDGEDVIPEDFDVAGVDAAFVLKSLEKEPLSFIADEHAYLRLMRASKVFSSRRQRICAIIAPNPEMFAAFLGLDDAPEKVFDVQVLYLAEDALTGADKCVVVGGPTDSVRDATHGVIVDMGD